MFEDLSVRVDSNSKHHVLPTLIPDKSISQVYKYSMQRNVRVLKYIN